MAKILIVGNPDSPHVRERGLVGQEAGHEIVWFSHRPANLPGVKSYHLPKIVRNSFVLRAVFEPIYLLAALLSSKPDLVHVHYASQALSAWVLSFIHPLVVSVMGGDILPNQGFWFPYAPFTRRLLKAADVITSKSAFLDSALLAIGPFRDKIVRVTWGVDLDRFSKNADTGTLRKSLAIPSHAFVFFDPRNAKPFYNKEIILKGFARFFEFTQREAVLVVSEQFGTPLYLKKLKDLARELGIESKVRFVGQIDHQAMPSFYALSDVTVSIPPSDGLPQSLYEAMACGSFPIMQDLPQYRGVLEEGRTAKLIKHADVELLAEGMLWTADHPDILSKAAQLSRTYVEREANRSVEVKKVRVIYQRLLAQQADRKDG